MRVRGGRFLRVAVVWTLLTFVIAVLVAAQAMLSLYDGQQACFFNYPAVACPTNEDPAIADRRLGMAAPAGRDGSVTRWSRASGPYPIDIQHVGIHSGTSDVP